MEEGRTTWGNRVFVSGGGGGGSIEPSGQTPPKRGSIDGTPKYPKNRPVDIRGSNGGGTCV